MTNRYEILDILSQDSSGVCFFAQDRESGRDVALRRFFPFGPDGGGLQDEERVAYEIGVKRLREVSHPALRSVLDGGTDPVDGMPFLVTEWVEGQLLSDRLTDGPLSPESVRGLADLALETSKILSEAFGEEAIWVETDPTTVIVSEDNPERQITFWISPLRWLGDPSARSDLKPLLEMVEELSGWKNQMISRNSGAGLGAWVRTLRDEPNVWTLSQAKEALHEPATIVEAAAAEAAAGPPPPAPQPIVFVNRPVVWPWILISLIVISVAGILGWKYLNPPTPPPPIAGASPLTPPVGVEAITEDPDDSPKPETSSKPETQREAMNRRAAEMAAQAENTVTISLGETATVEGTIIHTESSKSGVSNYFRIKTTQADQELWIMFRSKDWENFDVGTLADFKGKRAKFTGRWGSESGYRKHYLRMRTRDQLELLD